MNEDQPVGELHLDSLDEKKFKHEEKIQREQAKKAENPKEQLQNIPLRKGVTDYGEQASIHIDIEGHQVQSVDEFMKEFLREQDFPKDVSKKLYSKKKEFGNYLFFFRLKARNHDWVIRRRHQDFASFHRKLQYEMRKLRVEKEARLPTPPTAHTNKADPDQILKRYEDYLVKLVNNNIVRRKSMSFYEFFELGRVQLDEGVKKYKEGYIRKRTGGRYNENKCALYCGMACRRWMIRWFVVCQDGVLYTLGCEHATIREMLLFDSSFEYFYGRGETGSDKGITLLTPTRKLCLKSFSIFEAIDWLVAIHQAKKSSPYTDINRYFSFAPEREPTANCNFYVDGENYFSEICDALLEAQKEVFICDWWLSPELYLKRPVGKELNQEYRLDRVLQKIAERGVKIYVIIYKEVTFALYNDSRHSKNALESLSPNIQVLLHPAYFIFMWSHHEKLLVIDQKVGFMGGLDLCFGRTDRNSHPLIDEEWLKDNNTAIWPGIDYYNVREKDFQNVQDFEQELYDRNVTQRMPWHDISIKVAGDPVKDMCRHFIQYWNFVKTDVAPKKKQYFLTPHIGKDKKDSKGSAIGGNIAIEEKPSIRQRLGTLFHKSPSKKTSAPNPSKSSKNSNNQKLNSDQLSLGMNKNWEQESKVPLMLGRNDENESSRQTKKDDGKLNFTKNNVDRLEAYIEHIQRGAEDDTSEFSALDDEGESQDEHKQEEEKGNESHSNKTEEEEKGTEHNKSGVRFVDLEADSSSPSGKGSNTGDNRSSTFQLTSNYEGAQNSPQSAAKARSSTVTANCDMSSQHTQTIGTTESRQPQAQELQGRCDPLQATQMTITSLRTLSKESLTARPTRLITMSARSRSLSPDHHHHNIYSSQESKNNYRHSDPDSASSFKNLLHRNKNMNDDYYAKNLLKLDLLASSKDVRSGSCKCQMVRSSSKWSLGLKETTHESSIQIAYLNLIRNAKNFIYIENQFFISEAGGDTVVHNQISEALIMRIKKAAERKEKFRVVVFLPLLPGFEGEIYQGNAAILKIQMYWEYATISRGGTSILEKLAKDPNIEDPSEYISFYSLRQHAKLNGEPVTELIYIHSKVMIVDDRKVIIGSANINDRSMQGTRDSEIAMVIEDEESVTTKMNGKRYKAGKFAYNLRRELYKEHLGLSDDEVMDPISDDFWKRFNGIAEQNTKIYREVFAPYPDDTIAHVNDVPDFINGKKLDLYDEKKDGIQGHIVQFPTRFLHEEDLNFTVFDKEYFLPNHNFTTTDGALLTKLLMLTKKEYSSVKTKALATSSLVEKQASGKLKISWVVEQAASGAIQLVPSKDNCQSTPLLGLCSAPGKKVSKGRDGKAHNRDITEDMADFKRRGVSCVVCLLNKYELRTLGIDLGVYQRACSASGIEFHEYPLVEMAPPDQSPEEFDKFLSSSVCSKLEAGKCVVVHCRGGIGRAGLVACCLLLRHRLVKSHTHAIKTLRTLRDPRSVESRKQEDYIKAYATLIEVPSTSNK